MSRSDFAERVRDDFERLADQVFSDLKANEEMTLSLSGEDSLFVRFNGGRVRQNTHVEQIEILMKLHADGRSVESSISLTGHYETDVLRLNRLLSQTRDEARVLPIDPHLVPFMRPGRESGQEFGRSIDMYHGQLLDAPTLIETVTDSIEDVDLAGLYAGGPVISANRNSHGQEHWFSTESFFLDYSLYNGPKAAKAVYAGTEWISERWRENLGKAREQLRLLDKPTYDLSPGKYRAYLAPGAVSELISIMSWGALSGAAWKTGSSPFKKFADGETKLSPLFHLRENFTLGLTPRFNSRGEVAPETISLVENGELRELLVNTRTAKEFDLVANAATDHEGLRSPEIIAGELHDHSVLSELGTGLYLSNLHYLNWSDRAHARVTGMTRYACFWVENGEVAGPIKDLRFDESLYEALGPKLMALSSVTEIDPAVGTYYQRSLGGRRVPGLLIDDFSFRG